MLRSIIIPAVRPRHLRITAIKRLGWVVTMMAVMMVRHISLHIRLIMVDIHRLKLRVIRRESPIIIR